MEDKDRFDAFVLLLTAGPTGNAEDFARYLLLNASAVEDAIHILKTSPHFAPRTRGRLEVPAGPNIPTAPSPAAVETPLSGDDLAAQQDLVTGTPLGTDSLEPFAGEPKPIESKSIADVTVAEAKELIAAATSKRELNSMTSAENKRAGNPRVSVLAAIEDRRNELEAK